MLRFAALALLGAVLAVPQSACGTLEPPGGGASDLPVSGAGPYRRPDENPFLLNDPSAALDDPQVFADGDRITVYFTRTPKGKPSVIQRAVFQSLDDPNPQVDTVLTADAGWEGNSVSQPAVLPPQSAGAPWLLLYTAASGLGLATSPDGLAFQKLPGPVLVADPAQSETTPLSSPAVLTIARDGAAALRLLYLSAGAIWAADTPLDSVQSAHSGPSGTIPTFTRIDQDPATPTRDPLLRAPIGPWLLALGRFTARTFHTTTAHDRYDLFLSGYGDGQRVIGMASSWDAEDFTIAGSPFYNPKPPDEWAPTVTAYGPAGSLLLFATPSVAPSAIGVGLSP